MLKWFKELKVTISHLFSWNRGNSADINARAKSKRGNATATTGNDSPIQTADRDINNIQQTVVLNPQPMIHTNAIDHEDNWRELIRCFIEHPATKIPKNFLNPHAVKKQQEVSNIIKWINQKFNTITLSPSDPRAAGFIELRDRSNNAIREFVRSQDQEQFQQRWLDIGAELQRRNTTS